MSNIIKQEENNTKLNQIFWLNKFHIFSQHLTILLLLLGVLKFCDGKFLFHEYFLQYFIIIKNIQMYNIQDSMISPEEYKNSRPNLKQSSTQLIEKFIKLDLTRLNLQSIRQLYPALNNTYICVDYQANSLIQSTTNIKNSNNLQSNLGSNPTSNIPNNANLGFLPTPVTSTLTISNVTSAGNQNNNQVIKKIIHFTVDCKILGQLIIKQPSYELFMLTENFVNIYEYCDKKPQSCIVQWNLETHQVINVNYNRQIFPMLKIFSFRQSDTFCIVQYDQNMQNIEKQKIKQAEQVGTYHTKFKLAYFKFPLKKQYQKPHMVFKTHTNPKQYGFNQEIIKLNNHSMVGSISTKMNENDQTLLKTFDFKNNPMGVQVNYKFHVQINYRKQLLQLWITDIWEIRPQNFYLKCQLKVDRNKEQKYFIQNPNKTSAQTENIQQSLHLTWAYKSQNTLKFAKFKTPLLNHIQFTDNFNPKQRVRVSYQKSAIKQKVIKIQSFTSTQPLSMSLTSSINTINTPFTLNSSTSSSMSSSLTSSATFSSPLNSQTATTITPIANTTISSQNVQKSQQVYIPPPTTFIKSVHKLPIFFINNQTQEIVQIERQYFEWMVSYPAYAPRTLFFYRTHRQNDKIIQVVLYKIRELNNNRQMSVFLLSCLFQDWDIDLVKAVGSLVQLEPKYRELQNGWRVADTSKVVRELKSKTNIQNK